MIEQLLKEIGQEYPPCGFDVGPRWFPHVAKALREIAALGVPWRLQQVKQKFCGLRIYWSSEPNEAIEAIIRRAEAVCDVACEKCGGEAPPGMRMGRKLCGPCMATRR